MIQIICIETVIFIITHILPICGLFIISQKLYPGRPERIAMGLFLCFLYALLSFAALGYLQILSLTNMLVLNIICGTCMIFFAGKCPNPQPAAPAADSVNREPDSAYSRRLFAFITLCLAAYYWTQCMVTGGTDPWLYHLFFPFKWCKAGMIYPVSLAGLPHEYFPLAAEIILGYLVIPGEFNIFYPALQFVGLIMAGAALAGVWKFFKYSALTITAAILLLASTKIIVLNSTMCYTDVLTGSFLVTGICFMLQGFFCRVNDQSPGARANLFMILSGGIALGCAAGMKYSGLVAAPLLTAGVLAALWIIAPLRKQIEAPGKKSLLLILGASVSGILFYLPNFISTGNPFYPVRIPPFFPQGVDFPRETIPAAQWWSFFVNSNHWAINYACGILYLFLFIAPLLQWMILHKRKKTLELRQQIALLFAAIAIPVVILHLLIYPAMAQPRQIIPLMLAAAFLLPAAIELCVDCRQLSMRGKIIFTATVLATAFWLRLDENATLTKIFIAAAVVGLITARFSNRLFWRSLIASVVLAAFTCGSISYFNIKKYAAAHALVMGGNAARNIYIQLNEHYGRHLSWRIASVGSWYNKLLLNAMDQADIICVPVNAANTTSPHKLKNLSELRNEPVPYPVYRQRLLDLNCDFLLIDLKAHLDFFPNRDLELKWALQHPEDFELRYCDEHIYFFAIKK